MHSFNCGLRVDGMSAILNQIPFPWERFFQVSELGSQVVRPLADEDGPDPQGWNTRPAWPPSYRSLGWMRVLLGTDDALAISAKSMLAVASGDGALCSMLVRAGRSATANELREDHLRAGFQHHQNGKDVRILGGNFLDLDPKDTGQFDLVVVCEILDHVAHR